MCEQWNKRWTDSNTCRQTKLFFPRVDTSKKKDIMKLSRKDMGLRIRYTADHAHLRRHNDKLGIKPMPVQGPLPNYKLRDPEEDTSIPHNPDAMCRLCKLPGKEETPWHLLTDCPKVCLLRRTTLGYLLGEVGTRWKPEQLVRFFDKINLENKGPVL